MTGEPPNAAQDLRESLQPGPDCLALERFGEPLLPAEAAHVRSCPRCQTELALFTEFETAAASPDEGAAVAWITRELARRRDVEGPRSAAAGLSVWRRWLVRPAWAAVALVAAIAVVALWDTAPQVRPFGGGEVAYRTTELKVLAPVGDQKTVPSTFVWDDAPGVVQYNLDLVEVDGTLIWQTSVATTRVTLPSSVLERFVPGKTLRWKVTGRDVAGVVVAESGTQQFRILP
jgi:hypothetical protein